MAQVQMQFRQKDWLRLRLQLLRPKELFTWLTPLLLKLPGQASLRLLSSLQKLNMWAQET